MKKLKIKNFDPDETIGFKDKEECEEVSKKLLKELYELLYLLFANNKHSLLVVLHGIDASGKDGVINHIFSGANPQGMEVRAFKKPSDEELKHDFLWRCHRHVAEAGRSVIFNRSYYEEVTTVKIHPEMLELQHLPDETRKDPNLFKTRYRQINDFERMLSETGTTIVKILLNISKDEQRDRLKDRLQDKTKHWKFSVNDIKERKFWNDYMDVFQKMLDHTSTKWAPWHVIPANHKWYRNYLVSEVLVKALRKLDMKYPKMEETVSLKDLK